MANGQCGLHDRRTFELLAKRRANLNVDLVPACCATPTSQPVLMLDTSPNETAKNLTMSRNQAVRQMANSRVRSQQVKSNLGNLAVLATRNRTEMVSPPQCSPQTAYVQDLAPKWLRTRFSRCW